MKKLQSKAALDGKSVYLWRGSPRTLPMGSFSATVDELADVLRKYGYTVKERTK